MMFDNLTPKEKADAFYEAGFECAIELVLKIVDQISDNQVIQFGYMAYGDGKEELRNRILALKGGEQK